MTEPLRRAEEAVANLEEQILKRGRRARQNQQVYDASAIPVLVALFVKRLLSNPGDVDDALLRAVRKDPAYIEVFVRIGTITDDFAACLLAFDEAGEAAAELADRMTTLADDLLGALDAALDAFEAAVGAKTASAPARYAVKRQAALRMASGIRLRVRARQEIQRFERRLPGMLPDAEAVRQERTRRHYASIEKKARRTADRLRLTVLVLLGVVTVVLVVLGLTTGPPIARTGLLLLATVPVLMLAAYLALESTWHRLTERWARELANVDRVPPADDPVAVEAGAAADPGSAGPDAAAGSADLVVVADPTPDEPDGSDRTATGS